MSLVTSLIYRRRGGGEKGSSAPKMLCNILLPPPPPPRPPHWQVTDCQSSTVSAVDGDCLSVDDCWRPLVTIDDRWRLLTVDCCWRISHFVPPENHVIHPKPPSIDRRYPVTASLSLKPSFNFRFPSQLLETYGLPGFVKGITTS